MILCFLWVLVPFASKQAEGIQTLSTKLAVLALLSIGSIWYKSTVSKDRYQIQMPPAATWAIDDTYGYFSSYLILPLLAIAEDKRDYSAPSDNSAQIGSSAYNLFLKYNTFVRLLFGGLLCFYFGNAD